MPDVGADEHILNARYVDIDKRLQNQGKSQADVHGIHMQSPHEEVLIIQRELDNNVGVQLAIVAQYVPPLNSDQLTEFTSIMSVVNDSKQYPKSFCR